MLHPHVSEEVKGFGKHLFATFLGLLMALGLEQWREYRVEVRLARECLEQVNQELQENLLAMRKEHARIQRSHKVIQDLDAFLSEGLKRDPGRFPLKNQTPPGDPDQVGMGLMQYRSDAWETLKTLGALRHLSPALRSSLSDTYNRLSVMPQGQRLNFDPERLRGLFRFLKDYPRIREMERSELLQMKQCLEAGEELFTWSDQEFQYVIPKTETGQHNLERHLAGH